MLKKAGFIAAALLGVASSPIAYAKDVRPAAVAFNTPAAVTANQGLGVAPARVRVAKRHDFLGLAGLPLIAVVGGAVVAGTVIAVVSTDSSSPS